MAEGRTAILIPSLGRPQYVQRVFGNIERNTPEPHLQVWCTQGWDYREKLMKLAPLPVLYDDTGMDDTRYVTRMNKMVRTFINGPTVIPDVEYLFFGSDDVVFHPHWLSHAMKVMKEAPDAQVVVVDDMRNPAGTQALVDVRYLEAAVFDEPGNAFFSGYEHNFADTEMFRTAEKHGVIYRAMDSKVEHLHPLQNQGGGGRPWDKTYADAQGNWHHDAALFGERMEMLGELFD